MKRYFSKFTISTIMVLLLLSPVAAALADDIYKVGVGDVLLIKVLDHEELTVSVQVSFDGTITFPYIGTMHVLNKSIKEIEKKITQMLSKDYIKYPVVNVMLTKSESRKIFTYGEVTRIGTIPFADNMTLLNALSLAGGVTKDGMYGKLIIKSRKDSGPKYVDLIEVGLNNGMIEDKKIRDMALQIDDILIVEKNKTFLIQGEVANRGRMVLERDMTVLNAFLQAGGVTNDGLHGKLIVRRKQESGSYQDIAESNFNYGTIENKEIEKIVLRPDDILFVERSKTFLIQGEVANRGRMVLEKDMTVLSAFLQAGGVTTSSRFGVIKIRRKMDNGTAEYTEIASSNLNEGVIENKEVEDLILQQDDILAVERDKTFLIYGEVNKTGEYILQKDMTVFKAITMASGFTKWGSGNKVYILRSAGDGDNFKSIRVNINDVINGKAGADIKLMAGDIIVVSSGIF